MGGSRILIIGAGVAGLSAGSYLQRNGYETELFEAHAGPGGLPPAAKDGRDLAIRLCKRDGKTFTAEPR